MDRLRAALDELQSAGLLTYTEAETTPNGKQRFLLKATRKRCTARVAQALSAQTIEQLVSTTLGQLQSAGLLAVLSYRDAEGEKQVILTATGQRCTRRVAKALSPLAIITWQILLSRSDQRAASSPTLIKLADRQ